MDVKVMSLVSFNLKSRQKRVFNGSFISMTFTKDYILTASETEGGCEKLYVTVGLESNPQPGGKSNLTFEGAEVNSLTRVGHT